MNDESLTCRMAPRLQLVWKRGPLAPVVVVGEGQVNLVYGRCSGHGESLQSFVVDDRWNLMNQIDPPVAIPSSGIASGLA